MTTTRFLQCVVLKNVHGLVGPGIEPTAVGGSGLFDPETIMGTLLSGRRPDSTSNKFSAARVLTASSCNDCRDCSPYQIGHLWSAVFRPGRPLRFFKVTMLARRAAYVVALARRGRFSRLFGGNSGQTPLSFSILAFQDVRFFEHHQGYARAESLAAPFLPDSIKRKYRKRDRDRKCESLITEAAFHIPGRTDFGGG